MDSILGENIDFNARDSLGKTQFTMPCIGGHNSVVKLKIKAAKH